MPGRKLCLLKMALSVLHVAIARLSGPLETAPSSGHTIHPSKDDAIFENLEDIVNLDPVGWRQSSLVSPRLSDQYSAKNRPPQGTRAALSMGPRMIHLPSDNDAIEPFEFGLPRPSLIAPGLSDEYPLGNPSRSASNGPTSNFPTGNTEPEDGLASRLRSTPDRQDRGAHQYQETNSSLGKHPRDAESVGVDHQIRPTKKLIQKLNENSSQFQYRLSVGDEEYVIRKAEKRYQGYANWTKVLSRHAEEFPPRDEEITQSAKQTIEDHIENFPVSFFHDERLPGRYGTTSLVEFHLPPIIFAWISHAPEYERKDYLERNQNMWTFKRNLRRKIRPIFRSLNIIHNMAASNGLHHEIPQLTQDTHKELLTWFHDLIFAENGSLSKKRSDNPKGGKTVDQARLTYPTA
ncbi:hypothetical protein MJO28_006442 [Puccinia striiformis f. sp. tritici]|uniref:Uncharacterized protein n=4 Tax=Puccinia striiformis TaxID=27350 RepID=A0A2S4WD09_9BASI|nr:hypothetical protein MJO28_006442 [Puccinia striiformis f. sp. tritici]KAI7958201.1 hypothetical protein MJO29_006418 [Puccinia striiformis f. sp. tritici]POV96227.1 hypothetical protein PSTT_15765 [Puccinia striiformis]POW19676.1 hypothetical protein PSHT_04408 [Puccinia striiformis]